MKFQVFFLLVIAALALAEKDKDIQKDKPKDVKPIESIPIRDRPLVNQPVYDVPIEDDIGKLSVMDWESFYDTSPFEVLRRLRVDALPYIYNRGVYPGLPYIYNRGVYPGYLQYPQIYPYGRYGGYGPQQFYNNFGYYPIA